MSHPLLTALMNLEVQLEAQSNAEVIKKDWGLARVADDGARAVVEIMAQKPADFTVWGFLEEDVLTEYRDMDVQFRAWFMEMADLAARRRSFIDNLRKDDPIALSEEERCAYNEKMFALNEEARALRNKRDAWIARFLSLAARLRAAISSLPPDDEQAAELDAQVRLLEALLSFFLGSGMLAPAEIERRFRRHIEGLPPDLLQLYRQTGYRLQAMLDSSADSADEAD